MIKAITVRFNVEIDSEADLYRQLESDLLHCKSASTFIKEVLFEHYNRSSDLDIKAVISQSQNELIEKIYDVCLKIIASAGNGAVVTEKAEVLLPKVTEDFPESLTDVLDLFEF